ncbi:GNAT family N-acetyltransferase [Nocardioidaceae bacterium]|nr:GNAT family N-acetyltransferase [Nocardioidaceae bacterium]
MTIAELTVDHVEALTSFFARMPEGDVTFIKVDVSPEAIATWPDAPGARWVEVDQDGTVQGFVVLYRLSGLSDHVAELRLVVDPDARGRGIGRALAQHAVAYAVRDGLLKVVVEMPAARQRVSEMFLDLGFTGEALLRDHFRDRDGQVQDLIMLAYLVEEAQQSMSAVGMAEVLDEG